MARRAGLIWVAVLAVICVMQIVRAETVGAVVYAAAAVLVAADVLGVLPTPGIARRPGPHRLAVVGVVLAVILCVLPPHGAVTQTVLVILLGATLLLAWPVSRPFAEQHRQPADRRPIEPQPSDPTRTRWPAGLRRLAVAWTLIILAGCAFEVTEFILGRVHPHSAGYTLSDLLDPVASHPVGRGVLVCAWLALGWFLLNRGHNGEQRR